MPPCGRHIRLKRREAGREEQKTRGDHECPAAAAAAAAARCRAECRLADVTSDPGVVKLVEKSRRPAVTISAQPPPPPPPPPPPSSAPPAAASAAAPSLSGVLGMVIEATVRARFFDLRLAIVLFGMFVVVWRCCCSLGKRRGGHDRLSSAWAENQGQGVAADPRDARLRRLPFHTGVFV